MPRLTSRLGSVSLLAAVAAYALAPSCAAHGTQRTAPPLAVDWTALRPGQVVMLPDGVHAGPLVIASRGTREQPIVIRPAPGARPVITNSVVFTGAAHVRLEGITVTGSAYPAVIIKEGSESITLANSVIERSGLGVWITERAGAAHRIVDNLIHSHKTHGVAVDRVNAGPGRETIFAGNRVYGNGYHGFEINGSYYIVEGNEVFDNGGTLEGTSGIHVFAKSEHEDTGDHNIIRYNITYRNRAPKGPDGNGIQLDQWCDNNEVSYNLSFENDGAGISVFDAAHNRIFNNTLYNNMRDPGRSHPYLGELVLASDFVRRVDRTRQVMVANNIIVAARPGVYALFVDRLSADNPLSILNNLLHHAGGGELFFWATRGGRDLRELERLAGGSVQGNLEGDPMFTKGTPAAVADFAPRQGSPALRRGIPLNAPRDLRGASNPPGARPDLGALQGSR